MARGKEGKRLGAAWAKHRQKHVGYADPEHPFRLQGSADLNSYKLFAEVFWNLLRTDGRLGVILPTGIYSDFGTKDLREDVATSGPTRIPLCVSEREEDLFGSTSCLQAGRRLFADKAGGLHIHFRTRSAWEWATRRKPTRSPMTSCATNSRDGHSRRMTCGHNSPKTLSLVELRSQRDLDIFRKIYAHSIRIGDNAPGWEITYAREFHMTNDSKHFPPVGEVGGERIQARVFGRWIGPDGRVALPFIEGRMIDQFDFFQKGLDQRQRSNSSMA